MLAKLSESVFVSVGVTRGSDGIPAADFDNGSGTGGGDVVVPSATLSSTNSVWSNSGGGSAGDDGRDGKRSLKQLPRAVSGLPCWGSGHGEPAAWLVTERDI